jgi:hypothetical protein
MSLLEEKYPVLAVRAKTDRKAEKMLHCWRQSRMPCLTVPAKEC